MKPPTPWTPDGTPFSWIPKEAMTTIEQSLERGAAASAKLTYYALTRIANDTQSATFQKPINYIAALASLERRTVERRLADLERLQLVTVTPRKLEGTKANDLNEYTLANLSRKVATLSCYLATAPRPHAVAISKEDKKVRTEGFRKPIGTAERIGIENQLKILKSRAKELAEDTSEQWQRDEEPAKVEELRQLRTDIRSLEDSLL